MEKDLTFEEAIQNLENIVNELETGKLTLDESVKKFEEGMKISKDCSKLLEDAEKRITIILEKNGELKEEDFITVLIENSDGEMEEKKFNAEEKEGDK